MSAGPPHIGAHHFNTLQTINTPVTDVREDLNNSGAILLGEELAYQESQSTKASRSSRSSFTLMILTIVLSALIFLSILAWFDWIQYSFYSSYDSVIIEENLPGATARLFYALILTGITVVAGFVIYMIAFN